MDFLRKILFKFSKFSRTQKQSLLLVVDFLVLDISLYLSFMLRFEELYPQKFINQDIWLFILLPIVTIPFFVILGLYRAVLKHIGQKTILSIIKSITISVIIIGFLMMMTREDSFPRSIFIIYWFIAIIVTLGIRYVAYWSIYLFPYSSKNKIKVAIFGAGQAGAMLAESIQTSDLYKLEAIFDDDRKKIGTIINSVKVYDSTKIEKIILEKKLKIILLAIPSLGKSLRFELLKNLSQFPVKVMELPSVENIIDGRVSIDDVKNVQVEDILGRNVIRPLKELLDKDIKNKNVLITGAGGSIGSELSRQVLSLKPKTIILYEQSEFNLYSINYELSKIDQIDCKVIPVLASIHNKFKVEKIFKEYNIDTVFHAAAYKHVPMVEMNPCDGAWNNIIGTYTISCIASKYNVDSFVLISTDKAVRPANIMGATKRFCELILQGLNDKENNKTRFSMVRFGNVLDSAGSVLPLFRRQIKEGGPVTVTHSEIIRYFMSIPEAVQLVIQAGAMSLGGEVFVLDMGKPVNILNMAKKMIYLSGMTPIDEKNKNGDIEIKITGLRSGEKLYEELLIGNNPESTVHPRIMKAHEKKIDWNLIVDCVENIRQNCKSQDDFQIKKTLNRYIEDYKPKI